jgi:mannosidase alpha-like ER degradation enhancer 1
LFMGRDIVYSLNNITRVKCGFANVANVADRTLTDRMESFFLAETIKYLYLLFDDENFVNQNPYTFNTEGHLIPLRKEYLRTNSTMNVSLGQCKVQNDDNFFSIE